MDGDSRWSEEVQRIVERFQSCFDTMERYELLFEYANLHPSVLSMEDWDDENMVHGCQSRAHVECSLDVDGGFWTEAGVGIHLQGSEPRADELFCDGRESEALPHAGPQPRGLRRLEIEPRPEHGPGGRGVVDREMLVPRPHT